MARVRRWEDVHYFCAKRCVEAATSGDAGQVVVVDGYQVIEAALLEGHCEVIDLLEWAPFLWLRSFPVELVQRGNLAECFEARQNLLCVGIRTVYMRTLVDRWTMKDLREDESECICARGRGEGIPR